MEQLIFLRLKASDAAPKIATSLAPAATAASKPCACTIVCQSSTNQPKSRAHPAFYLEIGSEDRIPNVLLALDPLEYHRVVRHLIRTHSRSLSILLPRDIIRESVVLTCGTHLGETNDVASMADSPVSESILISFTLSFVDTKFGSFCTRCDSSSTSASAPAWRHQFHHYTWSPSRGPTSTILTCVGYPISARAAAPAPTVLHMR